MVSDFIVPPFGKKKNRSVYTQENNFFEKVNFSKGKIRFSLSFFVIKSQEFNKVNLKNTRVDSVILKAGQSSAGPQEQKAWKADRIL